MAEVSETLVGAERERFRKDRARQLDRQERDARSELNRQAQQAQAQITARQAQLLQQTEGLQQRTTQALRARRDISTQTAIRSLPFQQRQQVLRSIGQERTAIGFAQQQIRSSERELQDVQLTLTSNIREARRILDTRIQQARAQRLGIIPRENLIISGVERQLSQSLPTLERQRILTGTSQLINFTPQALVQGPIQVRQFGGVVTLPPQDPFSRARRFVRTRGGQPGAQFADPFISLGELGAGLATQPRQTVTGIVRGTGLTARQILRGESPEVFQEIGRTAQDPPAFTARVLAEGSLFFSPFIAARATRLAGFPRISTRFVAQQAAVGEGGAIGRLAFQTEQRGLFSTRRFLGAAQTDIRAVPSLAPDAFAGATRGIIREIGVGPTGRITLGRPRGFTGAELSRLTPQEINVLIARQAGIDVRVPLEQGFTFRGAGAGAFRGRDPSFFVSAGAGGFIGEEGFVAARAVPVRTADGTIRPQRAGISEQVGRISRVEPRELISGEGFQVTGQQLTSIQRTALQRQLQQQTQRVVEAAVRQQAVVRQSQIARTTERVIGRASSAAGVAVQEATQFPTIVGGTGAVSQFAGTGQFETFSFSAVSQQQRPRLETPVTNLAIGLTLQEKQQVLLRSLQIQKIAKDQRQRTIGALGIVQPQVQSQKVRLAQIQVSLVAQVQRQKTFQRLLLRQTTVTPARQLPRPFGVPIAIPAGATSAQIFTALKKTSKAFDVFTRIKGKDVKIGDDLPLGRALKLGAKFANKNIQASFKVIPDPGKTPKTKDIKFRPDPKVFRPPVPRSKLNIAQGVSLVERTRFRIDTPTEKAQLRAARRRKK